MTNKKGTKRALLSSVLALLLCMSMLIGTTFAWFTDSVTSGINNIVAGNLDIELDYWNATEKEWMTVHDSKDLFSKELWEPGHTEIVYLKLTNAGTLALEYQLGINIVSETPSVNVYDEPFKLSQHICFAVIDDINGETGAFANREDAVKKIEESIAADEAAGLEYYSSAIANGYTENGVMTKETAKEQYMALVVYMPTSVGNEANYKTGFAAPEIHLGINVIATQETYEEDSFNDQYDANASLSSTASYDWEGTGTEADPYQLDSAADLIAFANLVNGTAPANMAKSATAPANAFAGKYFKLTADVDLMNAEWTPIGSKDTPFSGHFDGNGHTIKNLKISGNNSNVGFFGYTTNGSVKNLTIENANVSGRLNVGVVAGSPYTSTYDNITVKGTVNVSGMAYVGGVFGKNVYANVSNITVDAEEGSCVYAHSIEGGVAYRTYVGGVIGFAAEGGHTISNVKSNINVIGSTCDVGGITGIAHYGNNFENITCTGNVTCLTEDETEIGGIAGVWHNKTGKTVTLTNCTFEGKINGEPSSALTGTPYSATETGKLIIDGKNVVNNADDLVGALESGEDVVLTDDVTVNADSSVAHSAYGDTGVTLKGGILDGNGNTLTVENANGTWDCAVYTTGGTIKNLTINGTFRGILVPSLSENLYIDNVLIDDVCYTFHTDGTAAQINDYAVYITNSTLNGWTSYSNNVKHVSFTNCTFGAGTGGYKYAFCRPYAASTFTNCVFEEGFTFDARQTDNITFIDCYVGDTLITAGNVATLLGENAANVKFPAVVSSAEDLSTALNNGGYVIMTDDVDAGEQVFVNKGTLDGGNKTIVVSSGDEAYESGLTVTEGTVKNITVTGAFRGLGVGGSGASEMTGDVTYENVTVKGATYGINIGIGNGHKLTMINCTLPDWNSYSGLGGAQFTNCTFTSEGNYYAAQRVSANATFTYTNCNFQQNTYDNADGTEPYYLDSYGNGTIVFENCYMDGVLITEENVNTLFQIDPDNNTTVVVENN